MMFVSFNSNTKGVTCGARTVYLSGAPGFTPVFSIVHFIDHCLAFWPFSFGHCVVCPSSIS